MAWKPRWVNGPVASENVSLNIDVDAQSKEGISLGALLRQLCQYEMTLAYLTDCQRNPVKANVQIGDLVLLVDSMDPTMKCT